MYVEKEPGQMPTTNNIKAKTIEPLHRRHRLVYIEYVMSR
jgi:hypothetical protein